MDIATNIDVPTLIDLLRNRRSVLAKNMSQPGPDASGLNLILEAGIRVPDHGKIGPWRIKVLDKVAQAMLGDLFAVHFASRYPNVSGKRIELERLRPQKAPILIVVSSNLNSEHSVPEVEQLLSCGAVCMNLLNASEALGYAAQWLTGWPAYDDSIKQALGIPIDQHIVGFIYIGTATKPAAERDRPSRDSVVSYLKTIPVGSQ